MGRKTRLMGILNATPDSFSDGGKFLDPDTATARAEQMLDDGAAIIDIGGESTRPGAEIVPTEIEIQRVVPIVERLKRRRPDAVISVDTTKQEVAEAALKAGADILNDVRGAWDQPSEIAGTAAEHGAGLVIMHSRGTPGDMRGLTDYDDIVREVRDALSAAAERAIAAGVARESIVLDPGLGFAKNAEGSLELTSRIAEIAETGFPILVGHSRKSFIGWMLNPTDPPPPENREWGTAAVTAWLVMRNVDIVRVHDVHATKAVVDATSKINRGHVRP